MEIEKLFVEDALAEYKRNRDLEPLAKLLDTKDGLRYLAYSDEARQILAQAARGLSVKGKGRAKTQKQRARDRIIAGMVALLNGMGLVVKNNLDKNRDGAAQTPSACRCVAEYWAISEDAVYKVWKNAPGEHFAEIGTMGFYAGILLAEGKVPSVKLLYEVYGKKPAGER
ncbi:hypothetical protein [Pseudomonas sp. OIL-1]|uniref:hypothetical protein n=1 Tax=Pseudomonas sp. OIL-1 TaxID=2706126 RepID=UPI0013A73137|nr:hypothetical protein [Pseudomonas sp. OIL-1]QIB52137.1 hypothetical protein G3M63_14430 [Pseudomonas sp. OIL-1]